MQLYDAIAVALLAAFLVCVFIRLQRWRAWSVVLAGGAGVIGLVHLGVEHGRWQMIPAYIVLFAVLALTPAMYWRPLRCWFGSHGKTMNACVLSGAVVLALTLVASWFFPMFDVPEPTGPFVVGTTEFHFVDAARSEVHTPTPLDRRELMVRVWYPATVGSGKEPVPYWPDARAVGRAVNIDRWPFGYFLGHLSLIPANSYAEAALSSARDSYPVLVFSHGLAMGHARQNTVLIEELASHGYAVFSISHTYDGIATVFPDGRIASFVREAYDVTDRKASEGLENATGNLRNSLETDKLRRLIERTIAERPNESRLRRYWYEEWSRDQRFVLDQLEKLQAGEIASPFAGRLELRRIGVFGMSFGGVAAARTCALDARCKAGINIDGFGDVSIENPPHRMPFMYFSNGSYSKNAVFMELDRGYRYFVQVKGTGHLDFTDSILISPKTALVKAGDGLDPGRMLSLINVYVRSFFDRHLLGKRADLLSGPSPEFPEILFLSRAPSIPLPAASRNGNLRFR